MFTYTWAVTIESDVELSEDVVNVISDLKEEFADAVDTVLDIEDEFNHIDEFVPAEQNEQSGSEQGDDVQTGQVDFGLNWF